MHTVSFRPFVDKHVLQAVLVTDLTLLLVVCDGPADRLGVARHSGGLVMTAVVDVDAKL